MLQTGKITVNGVIFIKSTESTGFRPNFCRPTKIHVCSVFSFHDITAVGPEPLKKSRLGVGNIFKSRDHDLFFKLRIVEISSMAP